MSEHFGPSRRIWNEIFTLMVIALVPIALFKVFPLEALRSLSPSPLVSTNTVCAFVTLTPAEERRALTAARAAWQINRDSMRCVRINLLAEALPNYPYQAVLAMPGHSDVFSESAYVPNVLPPTLAAPPPARITPQLDAGPVQVFSRKELLKLN